jgi:hypothetical protein
MVQDFSDRNRGTMNSNLAIDDSFSRANFFDRSFNQQAVLILVDEFGISFNELKLDGRAPTVENDTLHRASSIKKSAAEAQRNQKNHRNSKWKKALALLTLEFLALI